jgi:hypothetical protein
VFEDDHDVTDEVATHTLSTGLMSLSLPHWWHIAKPGTARDRGSSTVLQISVSIPTLHPQVEEDVKKRSTIGPLQGAKTLCIPFDQPPLPEGTLCFASGKPAKNWALWGRSY